ncbi:autophagy-related protein 16-1-like isoform X2 [Gordionus sp. m RMFG-2023]|uniref:autophagy-related protein 16-1-like isoform X2 n=1 Tax=Gordionus sp. m RMFG-2023 TaxID=3053472 RepID=UPI0031FCAD37
MEFQSNLYHKIIERDEREFLPFIDIIDSHNKVLTNFVLLKNYVLDLECDIGKLKDENTKLHLFATKNIFQKVDNLNDDNEKVDGIKNDYMLSLHTKLLLLQEELTYMLNYKRENILIIADMTKKLREKDDYLLIKEDETKNKDSDILKLKQNKFQLSQSLKELEATNQLLYDEQQALQLAFESLQLKYEKCQEENNELLERWLKQKSRDIDRINLENEAHRKQGIKQMSKDLIEAAIEGNVDMQVKDRKNLSSFEILTPILSCRNPSVHSKSILPSHVFYESINAHESEVTSLAIYPSYSNNGRIFGTGGADRKIKLWEIGNDVCECKSEFLGCSGGITSIQFDSEHTLTGHSGKVLSAKFLEGSTKVVSGSYDRTIKTWDLNNKTCIKTLFAGSSCNDLVVVEKGGNCIISGHIDKKVRIWDVRINTSSISNSTPVFEISLADKITSVDLNNDQTNILVSCRDDILKIFDIRFNNFESKFGSNFDNDENRSITNLKADGFHISFDWTRSCFSSDNTMVSCGNFDGSIYIWHCYNGNHFKINSDNNTNAPTMCTKWSLFGNFFITCDYKKRITVWS